MKTEKVQLNNRVIKKYHDYLLEKKKETGMTVNSIINLALMDYMKKNPVNEDQVKM